jgi:hypothetical protein
MAGERGRTQQLRSLRKEEWGSGGSEVFQLHSIPLAQSQGQRGRMCVSSSENLKRKGERKREKQVAGGSGQTEAELHSPRATALRGPYKVTIIATVNKK